MFNHDYIAYAMIAVGIFTFYMAIVNLFRSNAGVTRIRNAGDGSYMPEPEEDETPSAFLGLAEKVAKNKPEGAALKELNAQLAMAGIQSEHAVTYYLFCQRVLQPFMFVAGVIVGYNAITLGSGAVDIMLHLFVALILIIIGMRGAKLYVSNCRQKRKQQLADSFPEVMDLLLVCIESGLGLDAALNRVCKELRNMHPEVIGELDRTRLELTMLNDRVVALQNLAERTGTLAFNTLVSALIQTEKFGTSLVDTLRVLSEEQRMTRLYTAEQKAARIPVLITIPLILFIMPAFIMIILGPPIIKVINQGGLLGNAGQPH